MSELEPVVIELNSGDGKTDINLNTSSEPTLGKQPSVNFGGGIELLMNEKKKRRIYRRCWTWRVK